MNTYRHEKSFAKNFRFFLACSLLGDSPPPASRRGSPLVFQSPPHAPQPLLMSHKQNLGGRGEGSETKAQVVPQETGTF